MYTTNTATAKLPGTYATLRAECADLLRIATELEVKALASASFSDDPEFDKLRAACRTKLQSLGGLVSC